MIDITELQHDTLTEIINIGMGSAAAALSTMVRDEVGISVPQVSISSVASIQDHLIELNIDKLAAVRQNFSGELEGDAILLFPEDKSLEIVRMLLSNNLPMESEEFSELEQEALSEIGNIILNAGISSMANTLNFRVESSLPIYRQGNMRAIISTSDDSQAVLIVRVDLRLERNHIHGYVIYLMDIPSIDMLLSHIDRYLRKLTG